MQTKTTRAFRTISEAGDELDLQPHVLRFWESKFSQIKPIKRGGGRRFYRPEDIEFLRGIKILLHDEGHPIKDVQKLIRLKGANRVMELGQTIEKASREKEVKDTVLIPERLRKTPIARTKMPQPLNETPQKTVAETTSKEIQPLSQLREDPVQVIAPPQTTETAQPDAEASEILAQKELDETASNSEAPSKPSAETLQRRDDLEEALLRLQSLKSRWSDFKTKPV